MKRRGCLLPVQTLALLISSSLSLAFRTHIHVQRTSTTTATTKTATWDDLGGDHGRPFFRLHEHAARSSSSASRGALRMARASTLRADQKRRVKAATPVILSPKQHRAAKRARREYFREKFARSGTRLIKLQKEDPGSFYIGFVGTNRAGRGDALKAIETFLKKATELKVGYYYKDANIKLVDAGSLRISDMAGKDERKLGLLRRCDMLVHVVRCFELHKPKVSTREGGYNMEDGVNEKEQSVDEVDNDEEEIDWPVSATPLEDVKSTIGDMAYADLQFIQERHRSNHTKYFWRDKVRAYNEQKAIQLIEPELEDIYAVGGTLKSPGVGFRDSCLQDEKSENGTVISPGKYMRTAIREIGFLTPKPVIYVANLPEETVIPDESDNPSDSKANADGAEAIARVALAHADQVVGIEQEHGVPAVAGCLRARRGQDAVGAKVFKAIPRSVLARDPKAKKAAKSAENLRRKLSVAALGRRQRPRIAKRPRVTEVPPAEGDIGKDRASVAESPEP